jgi:hypothetical protein
MDYSNNFKKSNNYTNDNISNNISNNQNNNISNNQNNNISNNQNNNKFSLKISQPYCSSNNFNNNNWISNNMYWINDYNQYSDLSKYIVKEK